ncbi:hypothetical protein ACFT5D_07765 [Streptomyces sp. NPDC057144]|uniref:hypothetical protein n=1 Tax=Streptomyces sp. NPDC057144 TaxID=3346034 RepID=UPI00363BA7C1
MTTLQTEVHKSTSGEVDKPTTPLVRKYTTHLPPEMVKWIKREAVERDVKDYQIVEEAIRELQFKVALGR